MAIDFINLQHLDSDRTSHLSVTDKDPALTVGGELPHGYRFEPCTLEDAWKLIRWLETWATAQIDNTVREAMGRKPKC